MSHPFHPGLYLLANNMVQYSVEIPPRVSMRNGFAINSQIVHNTRTRHHVVRCKQAFVIISLPGTPTFQSVEGGQEYKHLLLHFTFSTNFRDALHGIVLGHSTEFQVVLAKRVAANQMHFSFHIPQHPCNFHISFFFLEISTESKQNVSPEICMASCEFPNNTYTFNKFIHNNKSIL